MALFRRRREEQAGPRETVRPDPARAEVDAAFADIEEDTGRPLRPKVAPVPEADLARIAAAVEELAAEGVDVDDLTSLGEGYDRMYAAWSASAPADRPDHASLVVRYALGIGEHLHRHTDLDWQLVTDVFGTDLAVAGGFSGSFSVVPANLVAARWMRGETGWVPGVIGHLVALRSH